MTSINYLLAITLLATTFFSTSANTLDAEVTQSTDVKFPKGLKWEPMSVMYDMPISEDF